MKFSVTSKIFRNFRNFCDKLDEVGELVSNNLLLNHVIFNSVFDKLVTQITEVIDKHALLKRSSRKQKELAKKKHK